MGWLRAKRWSPYVVGTLIGVLSWFAFWSVDRPIGVSTAVARTAGMMESAVATDHVSHNAYFTKFKPAIDWEWMLGGGAGAGGVCQLAAVGRPADGIGRPPVPGGRAWDGSATRRYLVAFGGGVLLMFGARLAGGCTSGHGISGSLQLALSGWVFFGSVFAAGMLAAFLLFTREVGRG